MKWWVSQAIGWCFKAAIAVLLMGWIIGWLVGQAMQL